MSEMMTTNFTNPSFETRKPPWQPNLQLLLTVSAMLYDLKKPTQIAESTFTQTQIISFNSIINKFPKTNQNTSRVDRVEIDGKTKDVTTKLTIERKHGLVILLLNRDNVYFKLTRPIHGVANQYTLEFSSDASSLIKNLGINPYVLAELNKFNN